MISSGNLIEADLAYWGFGVFEVIGIIWEIGIIRFIVAIAVIGVNGFIKFIGVSVLFLSIGSLGQLCHCGTLK